MPTYMYKAVNKSGLVVRNRVESSSRQGLIKNVKKQSFDANRNPTNFLYI